MFLFLFMLPIYRLEIMVSQVNGIAEDDLTQKVAVRKERKCVSFGCCKAWTTGGTNDVRIL